jgi:hypothetical protein
MVFTLADAAPVPLPYEELMGRRRTRASPKRGWKVAAGAAAVLLIVVAVPLLVLGPVGDRSPAMPDPGRLCEIVARHTDTAAFGPTSSRFSYEQLETDWEEALVVAPSEAQAPAQEALSAVQDSRVLAFSEQPPDDEEWAAIQDHYNNALDELHVWSTENCILTPEPQR